MPGPSLPITLAAVAVSVGALVATGAAAPAEPVAPAPGAHSGSVPGTGAAVGGGATGHLARPAAAVTAPAPAAAEPSSPGRPAVAPGAAGRAPRPGRGWVWPLAPDPVVARAFAVGPFRWSPGHRGVDLQPATGGAGTVVRAAGPGVVRFAGVLAGRGVVSVDHGSGLRTTYEPLDVAVRAGRVVRAGDPLGRLGDGGSHCSPAPCLHWGALVGSRYVDPLTLLRPREPPVLLPVP